MRSMLTTFLFFSVLALSRGNAVASSGTVKLEPLFQLKSMKGLVEIRHRAASAFEPAQKERAYPYGTALRTGPGGEAVILISKMQDFVRIGPNSTVIPDSVERISDSKVIRLVEGQIDYSISPTLANATNLLRFATPMVMIDSLKGDGRITLSNEKTLRKVRVAPKTESLGVSGWQFAIPSLKAESILEISSASDRSVTTLKNRAGDFSIWIERDNEEPTSIETSPLSSVNIWRKFAPVGGRLLVSVLVSDPQGRCVDQFSFPTDITDEKLEQKSNRTES